MQSDDVVFLSLVNFQIPLKQSKYASFLSLSIHLFYLAAEKTVFPSVVETAPLNNQTVQAATEFRT
jgi:hypothetical protein